MRKFWRWLRYQWHLGDCSAGGPPCGYDCLICMEYHGMNWVADMRAKHFTLDDFPGLYDD